MADNSIPVGAGTEPVQLSDDGLDAFLADSEESSPEEAKQAAEAEQPEEEAPEGEETEGEETEGDAPEKIYTLADGTQVSEQEFNSKFMPMAVYTRQRQQDSALIKEVEATQARLTEQASLIDAYMQQLEQTQAVTEDYLNSQIPAEPDVSLLGHNPTEYMWQKAHYDRSIQNLQAFAQQRHAARQQLLAQQGQNEQQMRALEQQKFAQAFPQLAANPDKLAAFDDANRKTLARYGIPAEAYARATTAEKRILGRLVQLEAKEAARARPQSGAVPKVQVQGKQAVPTRTAKDVQAFRQSRSADSAKKALASGAFDSLL